MKFQDDILTHTHTHTHTTHTQYIHMDKPKPLYLHFFKVGGHKNSPLQLFFFQLPTFDAIKVQCGLYIFSSYTNELQLKKINSINESL